MIDIHILSVRDPRWSSADKQTIDCWIRTNTQQQELPFTASPDDPEPHGRDIYTRCVAGEFGLIKPPLSGQETLQAPSPELQDQPYLELEARMLQFIAEANKENNRQSFRSVVIVWAARIDEILKERLSAVPSNVPSNNERSLRFFGQRIQRAAELGLIDSRDQARCEHIQKIRNTAAHEWDFDLDSTDVMTSLTALYQADHADTVVFHLDLDFLIQQVYARSCAMLMMRLLHSTQPPQGD